MRESEKRLDSARAHIIPIAPAAPPYVPLSAVSSLGGFRTPAAEQAAPFLKRPASETLHNRRRRHPNSGVQDRIPLIFNTHPTVSASACVVSQPLVVAFPFLPGSLSCGCRPVALRTVKFH